MRTRDEETKPPNRNSLIFHCHTEYSTVYRARAHEFTRDQNKEKHDTPEKAASTCKPASTGKERPSRRSGKPKLARRAAVKEGEPSRPLYPLSLARHLSHSLSLSLSLSLVPISLSPFRDASLSLSPLFFSLFRFSIYPVSSSPLRTQGSPSRAIPSSLHGVPRPTTIPSPRTISYTVQPTRSLFQPSPSSPARISIVCTVLFRSPHLGEARPRYAPLYNSARNFGNDALWCIRRLPSYFEFLTNRQPLCEYREFKLICL